MTDSLAIPAISQYAYDPAFLQVYNMPNPFAGNSPYAYQNIPSAQLPSTAVQPDTSLYGTGGVSFRGNSQVKESSGSGAATALITGTLILAGASAIYAGFKGKGNIIDGYKQMWNGIKGFFSKKASASTAKSAEISDGLKNIIKDKGNYTLKKEGMSIVMKDGKPVKIITADKEVISASKLSEFLSKHKNIQEEINKLTINPSEKLPKGVTLSYTKSVGGHNITVEGGKIVKVDGVAEKDLEAFIRNHSNDAKEALTLRRSFSNQAVEIQTNKGFKTKHGNLALGVRNGEIVSAEFNGRNLGKVELEKLKESFGRERLANEFTNRTGNDFGLTNFEYIYRQKGGQKIRFNTNGGSRNITGLTSVTDKTITDTAGIEKFLKENETIKTELENISSSGVLGNGYRFAQAVIKQGENTFTVTAGKIVEIKKAVGTILKGNEIKQWIKDASNKAEYDKVLGMIK